MLDLPPPPLPGPKQVIVRFEPGASPSDRADVRRRADVDLERTVPAVPGMQVVTSAPGETAERTAARLERFGDVAYAEPDVVRARRVTPNDPFFRLEWGLHNTGQSVAGRSGTADADIDAPEAWETTTGAAGITVAVIDSGIDLDHPDLVPNLHRNPREAEGTAGVDDDANGFTDDVRGWDFVERDGVPDDGDGHGTHVAGTVAARGNDGTGVTGVAWRASLLPLRVLGDDGSGRVSDAIAAYGYAGRLGVRVVNLSLGGPDFSRAERDAIRAAPDTLFVTAAGNDGSDNDATPDYPCDHAEPNIVCVAAIDQDGALASFSNFGARNVDLAAPGTRIASTYPDKSHTYLDGTSMASPHVAGVAALAWARDPSASVARVRDALLSSVTPLPSLQGKTVTGGNVNAAGTLAAMQPVVATAPDNTPAAAPAEPASSPPAPPAPSGRPDGGQPAPAPSEPPAPAGSPSAPIVSAPAPAPAPAAAPDGRAPALRVSITPRRRLTTALARGSLARVSCSEACTIRSELALGRTVVARGRGGARAGSTTTLTSRFTTTAKRRLRSRRRVVLGLRVRATDAAGNTRAVSRRLTLRRTG